MDGQIHMAMLMVTFPEFYKRWALSTVCCLKKSEDSKQCPELVAFINILYSLTK
jgi:hypothetical protein